ncbi:MAG: transglycosylase SLT domain-containing protein, partial [Candidatus Omnitrophica bacterium]|nr:transglycosylase SLT domain-containing protein [Candidatus Omnitrophota bacterium]
MLDARSNKFIFAMNWPFKVMVSIITLVAFFVNIFSYDLAWASESASNPVIDSAARPISVNAFALPQNLGHIRDSWQAVDDSGLSVDQLASLPVQSRQTGKPANRQTVIHIQDAHCNYAAQKKIAEIIEYLRREYGVASINLEGGEGAYDLSIFTDIGDKETRRRTADHFMERGVLSGAEYFAANNPGKISLKGAEDFNLYLDNLRVYRESLKYKDEVDARLDELGRTLAAFKTRVYSKALMDFDMKYLQYKAGNIDLKIYLEYLVDTALFRGIDLAAYSNLSLMKKALAEEAGIDFKAANNERDTLIDSLQRKLSRNNMEELVARAVEFKSGKISQKDFYAFLAARASLVNLDIGEFPSLRKYMAYILTYESADKMKAMDEMDALEAAVKETLFENDDQRELAMLSKNLAILKNIFNISITRADYEYFMANKDSFAMSRFARFIEKVEPSLSHPRDSWRDRRANEAISISNLYRHLAEMMKFYEYSFKRDEAFMKNIRKTNYEQRATQASILVTGGFHTENLAALFRKQNISYISILPSFTAEEGGKSPYHRLLSGNLIPQGKDLPASAGSLAVASPFNERGRGVYSRGDIKALESSIKDFAAGRPTTLSFRKEECPSKGISVPKTEKGRISRSGFLKNILSLIMPLLVLLSMDVMAGMVAESMPIVFRGLSNIKPVAIYKPNVERQAFSREEVLRKLEILTSYIPEGYSLLPDYKGRVKKLLMQYDLSWSDYYGFFFKSLPEDIEVVMLDDGWGGEELKKLVENQRLRRAISIIKVAKKDMIKGERVGAWARDSVIVAYDMKNATSSLFTRPEYRNRYKAAASHIVTVGMLERYRDGIWRKTRPFFFQGGNILIDTNEDGSLTIFMEDNMFREALPGKASKEKVSLKPGLEVQFLPAHSATSHADTSFTVLRDSQGRKTALVGSFDETLKAVRDNPEELKRIAKMLLMPDSSSEEQLRRLMAKRQARLDKAVGIFEKRGYRVVRIPWVHNENNLISYNNSLFLDEDTIMMPNYSISTDKVAGGIYKSLGIKVIDVPVGVLEFSGGSIRCTTHPLIKVPSKKTVTAAKFEANSNLYIGPGALRNFLLTPILAVVATTGGFIFSRHLEIVMFLGSPIEWMFVAGFAAIAIITVVMIKLNVFSATSTVFIPSTEAERSIVEKARNEIEKLRINTGEEGILDVEGFEAKIRKALKSESIDYEKKEGIPFDKIKARFGLFLGSLRAGKIFGALKHLAETGSLYFCGACCAQLEKVSITVLGRKVFTMTLPILAALSFLIIMLPSFTLPALFTYIIVNIIFAAYYKSIGETTHELKHAYIWYLMMALQRKGLINFNIYDAENMLGLDSGIFLDISSKVREKDLRAIEENIIRRVIMNPHNVSALDQMNSLSIPVRDTIKIPIVKFPVADKRLSAGIKLKELISEENELEVDQVVAHSPEHMPGAEVRMSIGQRVINTDVGYAEGYGGNIGYLEMNGDTARAYAVKKDAVSSRFGFNMAALIPVFLTYYAKDIPFDFTTFIVISFITPLIVTVILHEFFHYIAAKRAGASKAELYLGRWPLINIDIEFPEGTKNIGHKWMKIAATPYIASAIMAALAEGTAHYLAVEYSGLGLFMSMFALINIASVSVFLLGRDGRVFVTEFIAASNKKPIIVKIARNLMLISLLPYVPLAAQAVKADISKDISFVPPRPTEIVHSQPGPEPLMIESLAVSKKPALSEPEDTRIYRSRTFDPRIDDSALVLAHINKESTFDPFALSETAAAGPMQLVVSTARDLGLKIDRRWESSLRASIKYLKHANKELVHRGKRKDSWIEGSDGKKALYMAVKNFVQKYNLDLLKYDPANYRQWLSEFDERFPVRGNDIRKPVAASIDYLNQMSKRFSHINANDRLAFALSAYFQGPGHVDKARAQARYRGKNPDIYSHVFSPESPEYKYATWIINKGAKYTDMIERGILVNGIEQIDSIAADIFPAPIVTVSAPVLERLHGRSGVLRNLFLGLGIAGAWLASQLSSEAAITGPLQAATKSLTGQLDLCGLIAIGIAFIAIKWLGNYIFKKPVIAPELKRPIFEIAKDVQFENFENLPLKPVDPANSALSNEAMVSLLFKKLKRGILKQIGAAKSVIVRKIVYEASGSAKDILWMDADVDGRSELVGLRLIKGKLDQFIMDPARVERSAKAEVDMFNYFSGLDGVAISIGEIVNMRELKESGIIEERDELDNYLSHNSIIAVTIGDFALGEDLFAITDPKELEELLAQAMQTITRGWILTLEGKIGVAIVDEKLDNFVRVNKRWQKKGMRPVIYIDLGLATFFPLGVLINTSEGMMRKTHIYESKEAIERGSGDRWAYRLVLENMLKAMLNPEPSKGVSIEEQRRRVVDYVPILQYMLDVLDKDGRMLNYPTNLSDAVSQARTQLAVPGTNLEDIDMKALRERFELSNEEATMLAVILHPGQGMGAHNASVFGRLTLTKDSNIPDIARALNDVLSSNNPDYRRAAAKKIRVAVANKGEKLTMDDIRQALGLTAKYVPILEKHFEIAPVAPRAPPKVETPHIAKKPVLSKTIVLAAFFAVISAVTAYLMIPYIRARWAYSTLVDIKRKIESAGPRVPLEYDYRGVEHYTVKQKDGTRIEAIGGVHETPQAADEILKLSGEITRHPSDWIFLVEGLPKKRQIGGAHRSSELAIADKISGDYNIPVEDVIPLPGDPEVIDAIKARTGLSRDDIADANIFKRAQLFSLNAPEGMPFYEIFEMLCRYCESNQKITRDKVRASLLRTTLKVNGSAAEASKLREAIEIISLSEMKARNEVGKKRLEAVIARHPGKNILALVGGYHLEIFGVRSEKFGVTAKPYPCDVNTMRSFASWASMNLSAKAHSLTARYFPRIPVIGNFLSLLVIYPHEFFHALADGFRGTIEIIRENGRVVGGRYVAREGEVFRHPTMVLFAAPWGMGITAASMLIFLVLGMPGLSNSLLGLPCLLAMVEATFYVVGGLFAFDAIASFDRSNALSDRAQAEAVRKIVSDGTKPPVREAYDTGSATPAEEPGTRDFVAALYRNMKKLSVPEEGFPDRRIDYPSNEHLEPIQIEGSPASIKGRGGVYIGTGAGLALEHIFHSGADEAYIIDCNPFVTEVVWPIVLTLFNESKDRLDYIAAVFSTEFTAEEKILLHDKNLGDIESHIRKNKGGHDVATMKRNISRFELLLSPHVRPDVRAEMKKIITGFFLGFRRDVYDANLAPGSADKLFPQDSFIKMVSLVYLYQNISDLSGTLSTEEAYQKTRRIINKGRIKLVTGEVEGKAFKNVARDIAAHHKAVSILYISNIFDYFRGSEFSRVVQFFKNLRRLPVEQGAILMRSGAGGSGALSQRFSEFMLLALDGMPHTVKRSPESAFKLYCCFIQRYVAFVSDLPVDDKIIGLQGSFYDPVNDEGNEDIYNFIGSFFFHGAVRRFTSRAEFKKYVKQTYDNRHPGGFDVDGTDPFDMEILLLSLEAIGIIQKEGHGSGANTGSVQEPSLEVSLIDTYQPRDMKETILWLARHQNELGGNSLRYLMQALIIAGKLPEGASEMNWQVSAGAYDFYLNSPLLQNYIPQDIDST